MTDKTLGQVAELAFNEHLTPEEAMRLPEVLPHARYRAAWQAAAEAVVRESRADKMHAAALDLLKTGERLLREQAVIEAAKAWAVFGDEVHENDLAGRKLLLAVEALTAAEGEE